MADIPDFIPDAQMQALSANSVQPSANGIQPTATGAAPQGKAPGASPDFIPDDQFVSDEDKYDTTGQQIKAGLEGFSKGIIGSTLTEGAETKLLGVKPEDIEGRERINPITSGVGQAVGFGTGLLTGTGEAALIGKAGEAVAGLTAAGKALQAGKLASEIPLAARIGSEAVKQATEMAIMASDDVLAKKIFHDPELSMETALSEVGLSAALGGTGGAFMAGVANPLWKATFGPKVESFLSSLSGKLGGNAGEGLEKSTASELFANAGIDPAIAPSVMAKINGDPTAEQLFSKLSQTDTTAYGKQTQKELQDLTGAVGSKMAETLGRDTSFVENLDSKLDKYTRGNEIADSLHKEIENVVKPINEAYDATNATFKDSPVSLENKKVIGDKIAQKAIENGWFKSADEGSKNLMEKVLKKLPEQETAEDLKKFITNLRESSPFGSPTYGAAKDISNVLKEAQEQAVMSGIMAKGGTKEGGELALEHYKELKGQYSKLMDTIDGVNEHLKVGKYYGPKSFLSNLKEMGTTNAEGVLNRLSGTNKADTLNLLQQFPETLQKVKQYHADQLLASSRSAEGSIDPRKLMRNYDKLSPQLKALIADEESQNRMGALSSIIEKTNDENHNWSNTARTIDKLTHGAPSAISMMAAMLGHGGEGIAAYMGSLGLKEGTDAGRYAMLKFLGSDKPINAPGFKAMLETMNATIKGESKINKAVEAVFKTGALKFSSTVSDRDLEKLDKQVSASIKDQNAAVNERLVNSPTGHYLPEHQQALAFTSSKALDYLKSIKPQPTQVSPLDKPMPVSAAQEARYNRALTIASQPTVLMSHIKDGTLQMSDIQDIQAMYPGVYSQMQSKLTEQMVNRHADDEPVPYRTRVSLGLFLQHPMDATMTPESILAAQPKPQGSPQQQSAQNGSTKHSMNKLGKNVPSYRTPSQEAESDRASRHS